MQPDARLDEMQVHDYARQLFNARGDKAVADAAHNAKVCADSGAAAQAETWRRVEAAIKLMRGPHQS